jgi:hypothetical protein
MLSACSNDSLQNEAPSVSLELAGDGGNPSLGGQAVRWRRNQTSWRFEKRQEQEALSEAGPLQRASSPEDEDPSALTEVLLDPRPPTRVRDLAEMLGKVIDRVTHRALSGYVDQLVLELLVDSVPHPLLEPLPGGTESFWIPLEVRSRDTVAGYSPHVVDHLPESPSRLVITVQLCKDPLSCLGHASCRLFTDSERLLVALGRGFSLRLGELGLLLHQPRLVLT